MLEEDPSNDLKIELEDYSQFLDKFTQYYLIDAHPKSAGYLAFKIILLGVASTSSAWLYLEPSIAYGYRFHSETLGILQGVGNLLGAFFVTLNVSQAYIGHLETQYEIKRDLGELIEKTHRLKSIIENAIIITGAVVSAAVFTAPSIQYSTKLPLWLRILQAFMITGDYSLIHTFPMELLVNTRLRYIAGFPLYALYYGLYELPRQGCLLTPEQADIENLAAQIYDDQLYLKTAMIETLEVARKKIFDALFTGEFDFWACKLDYQLNYIETVVPALNQPKGMDQYLALLDYSLELLPRKIRNFPSWFDNYVNPVMSRLFWTAGAVAVPVSISGFIMSALNVGWALTGDMPEAWAFAVPPGIVTSVLVGYFGGKTFQGLYDYMVDAIRGNNEIPLPIKLYPKAVFLLVTLSAFLAYYSSGPAEELVYANFKGEKWNGIREILAGFARYGVQSYCFINMFEIIFAGINKFAKLVGGDDKMVVELSERIMALLAGIMQMDSGKFIDNLELLVPERRQTILGTAVTEEKFKEITVRYTDYKKLTFFREADDKQQLLSLNARDIDYSAKNSLV